MKHQFKSWLIFIVLWFWVGNLPAQQKSITGIPEDLGYYYTFEPDEFFDDPLWSIDTNNYSLIEFDNSGIWQIGHPAKGDWNSTCQGEYALMTDTAHLIDRPVKASFTFKFKRPWYSNCFRGWGIMLKHLYDLPIGKAGIYIDASYNEGETWWPLPEDSLPCYYLDEYGLLCTRAFYADYMYLHELGDISVTSGKKEVWDEFVTDIGKQFDDNAGAKNFGAWLRFTYENLDTVAHKGWMIDDLVISMFHNCEFYSVGENSDGNTSFYPMPLTAQSVLEFHNPGQIEFSLTVANLQGRVFNCQQTCESYFLLNRFDYPSGVYMYNIKNPEGEIIANGKFISN